MTDILLGAILFGVVAHTLVLYIVITDGVDRMIAALKQETGPQWTPVPEGVRHPRGSPDCPHKDSPIYAVHHTGATGCFACATKETP